MKTCKTITGYLGSEKRVYRGGSDSSLGIFNERPFLPIEAGSLQVEEGIPHLYFDNWKEFQGSD